MVYAQLRGPFCQLLLNETAAMLLPTKLIHIPFDVLQAAAVLSIHDTLPSELRLAPHAPNLGWHVLCIIIMTQGVCSGKVEHSWDI